MDEVTGWHMDIWVCLYECVWEREIFSVWQQCEEGLDRCISISFYHVCLADTSCSLPRLIVAENYIFNLPDMMLKLPATISGWCECTSNKNSNLYIVKRITDLQRFDFSLCYSAVEVFSNTSLCVCVCVEEAFMNKAIKYQLFLNTMSELSYRCTLLVFIFGLKVGLKRASTTWSAQKGGWTTAIIGSQHIYGATIIYTPGNCMFCILGLTLLWHFGTFMVGDFKWWFRLHSGWGSSLT